MKLPVAKEFTILGFCFRIGLAKPGVILWWDITKGRKKVGRLWNIRGKPQYWSRDVYENYRRSGDS